MAPMAVLNCAEECAAHWVDATVDRRKNHARLVSWWSAERRAECPDYWEAVDCRSSLWVQLAGICCCSEGSAFLPAFRAGAAAMAEVHLCCQLCCQLRLTGIVPFR